MACDQRIRDALLAGSKGRGATRSPSTDSVVTARRSPNCNTLDLTRWPPGTRAIARRERPHPDAQLRFTDADGWRVQVFITDQPDADIVELERRHRAHARVEDRICDAKDTGLGNLPFADWARNTVWVELVLLAQALLAWWQRLCLEGDLAKAAPKTLRYRLLHVAARVVSNARRLEVRLQRTWPWTRQLAAAFTRLRSFQPA
jgi:hypothetical protein